MPNKTQKIRVAVIGGGNMGKHHLRNYFNLLDTELVGFADINPETKKLADEFMCDFFTDYKKMLDELKPEAVSIVVPTPMHAEVASEVIGRGIHCLLEKPIAAIGKTIVLAASSNEWAMQQSLLLKCLCKECRGKQ